MITIANTETSYEFRGKQDDVKPIGNNCINGNVNYPIANGSVYLDMDNVEVYMLEITGSEETGYTGVWKKLE